jgi:hypothetical protein
LELTLIKFLRHAFERYPRQMEMNKHRLLRTVCLCVFGLVSWAGVQLACADSPPEPGQEVRKFDPINSSFVAVSPDKVVPGKIYSHYSSRHGRYVWAIALEGGKFSYALGQGSTEYPRNFDLVTSAAETQNLIASRVGDWAKVSQSQGRQILVRLQATGLWQVLQISSIRSHFDLDSGRRWEWHGERKVAVGHTGGYRWRYDGNRYQPANGWLSVSLLPGCPLSCACSMCSLP